MDKKLKNAADKIRMPEDMKQRIISAAELAEKNHINTDNDGYIEVVSSAERVDPRRGIIRTISAIAACAVLVGGIGTTGFLLHRQNSTQMSGSEVSGTECRSCPFGDFSEFDYRFDAGDGKNGRYSAETYAKLSDFLNKFNWGVELGMSEAENDDETGLHDLVYEKYTITWTKGDTPPVNCNIYVSKTGYVLYNEDIEYLETDEDHFIECRSYRIDFNAFDSGIQAIIAEDANNVSPFGDFSKLDYILNANDAKYGELSDDVRANLSDFLNNFNWGDEVGDSEIEANAKYLKFKEFDSEYVYDDRLESLNDDELIYTIAWHTSEGYRHINIVKGGYVSYTDFSNYIATDGVSVVIDSRCYKIDFDAFDRGIQEILKNDSGENALSKCEDSPFADILSQSFLAAPFAIENVQMTAAQRNDICSIFDSQTWYEFDGRGEYFGWIITPNRNNFTITCNNGSTVDVISVGYPDIACIYSRTYDENGNITDDDWKFYKCDDKAICAELAEVFGSDLGFRDVDIEEKQFVDPALGTEKDILDVVKDDSNEFILNYMDGEHVKNDKMTPEQRKQLISFFETYELKDEDLVPDMWKGCYGSPEFEELFGSSFIMISSDECVEKDISVSNDMRYIAIYSPAHYNDHGYDTRIYRLHDTEKIKDVYNIINGIE
ncbi:hypothetical protein [Ruminococcus flavefaciens]|uniref:hypothetical protein n=1 Tax=Ruminococcus flavefaciens TaxID=1265 RepID=UPI0026F33DBF|nr:hypothetical protein [Ruminococcus flavefaciens]